MFWHIHTSSYWSMHCIISRNLNSLRPSDTYICQHDIPTLLQIMACRLFGAKPLSEPMPPYCRLNHKKYISVKSSLKFSFRKFRFEMAPAKWRPLCLGLNVLNNKGVASWYLGPHFTGFLRYRAYTTYLSLILTWRVISNNSMGSRNIMKHFCWTRFRYRQVFTMSIDACIL